jgi:RNA polymerase sigma factor (sigma-70 family)
LRPVSEHSIDDLVKRCRKGDNQAFQQLYLHYNKSLFNASVRLLNNIPEAEDVLQESFITAFKNLSQLRESAGFGSWLKRIVINKSLDVLRKRNVRFTNVDEETIIDEEVVEQEADYDVQAIRAAVLKLPMVTA